MIPLFLERCKGGGIKIKIKSNTHILHDPCFSPVVGHKVARWDDDAEMVRILEQLQFGVHRADAVHGREAELDVGGDVASHEGFLNLGGKRIGQLHYILPFSICITVYPSLWTVRRWGS